MEILQLRIYNELRIEFREPRILVNIFSKDNSRRIN